MRRPARPIVLPFLPFLLLALTDCHKDTSSSAPGGDDEQCSGARCVEQAEAAMYYKDYDHAREPLTLVCEKKDGFQCFRLAELWQEGRGGPVDLTKAAKYYEDSCEYEHGEGCERRADLAKSDESLGGAAVELEFAMKGCQHQRPAACQRVAEQYRDGRGTARDDAKAIEYFEQACGLGETLGCTAAGELWMKSSKYDGKNRALSAFIRACTGHHPDGCLKVGVAFHDGIGTKPDIDKAVQHFNKACEWGQQDGCHAAEQIKAADGKPVDLELTTTAAELGHNGMQLRDLSCRMSDQGPAALDKVMASVARWKQKLDKCAEKGGAVGITWEFDGGRVREAKMTDRVGRRLGGCVIATLKKARMPATGMCRAIILVGEPEGATNAMTVRAEKLQKIKENHTVHISDDDE